MRHLQLAVLIIAAIEVAGPARTLAATAVRPELPREYIHSAIDPTYNRPADILVAAGGDLQLALNEAQPGQIV